MCKNFFYINNKYIFIDNDLLIEKLKLFNFNTFMFYNNINIIN